METIKEILAFCQAQLYHNHLVCSRCSKVVQVLRSLEADELAQAPAVEIVEEAEDPWRQTSCINPRRSNPLLQLLFLRMRS